MGQLARSLLPMQNPVGFGAADFVELAIAALIVILAMACRPAVCGPGRRFAQRTGWCMLALAVFPIALRLGLLPHFPAPSPAVSDDFSYLLLADTLSHWRLANPIHPLHQFFETFFVLQEPSYSSIFPPGQGVAVAVGRAIFGHPWAGILLSAGAFSSLCYWMLRAWTSPGWALLGGVLAVMEFGPLNQWMNSYWGGYVSAAAGCLVFGALPRLVERRRTRDAVLLGVGLALQLVTRPYEWIWLLVCLALFCVWKHVWPGRPARWTLAPLAAAAVLLLVQNKSVTSSWTTTPYQASRYQYGVPASFTIQANPVPHRPLTPEQQLDFEAQAAVHGGRTDTVATFIERLLFRVRYYRFFLLVPLYLTLPFFAMRLRDRRFAWVALTLILFAFGSNFYPYFYSHYIAVETCLFILVSIAGLERLSAVRGAGRDAATLVIALCAGHFVFWYGLHVLAAQPFSIALRQYETWDAINSGDPEARIAIRRRLEAVPGSQLVFVRYAPGHTFNEWVHNAADIDPSRIVWARDLGAEEDAKLIRYYPQRTVWVLEPDARPPRLSKVSR